MANNTLKISPSELINIKKITTNGYEIRQFWPKKTSFVLGNLASQLYTKDNYKN